MVSNELLAGRHLSKGFLSEDQKSETATDLTFQSNFVSNSLGVVAAQPSLSKKGSKILYVRHPARWQPVMSLWERALLLVWGGGGL